MNHTPLSTLSAGEEAVIIVFVSSNDRFGQNQPLILVAGNF